MKVYRMEYQGIGVYHTQDCMTDELFDLIAEMDMEHSTGNADVSRIVPTQEVMKAAASHLEVPTENVICACPTMEMLEAWIGDYYCDLLALGCEVVEYDVATVYKNKAIGTNQVLIARKDS